MSMQYREYEEENSERQVLMMLAVLANIRKGQARQGKIPTGVVSEKWRKDDVLCRPKPLIFSFPKFPCKANLKVTEWFLQQLIGTFDRAYAARA